MAIAWITLVGFYRTYFRPHDGGAAEFTPPEEEAQTRLGERVLQVFREPGGDNAEDLGVVPISSGRRSQVSRFPATRCCGNGGGTPKGIPSRILRTIPASAVATSGTHDTEPLVTWWDEAPAEEKEAVLAIPSVRARLGAGDRVRDALIHRSPRQARIWSSFRSRTCSAGSRSHQPARHSATRTGRGACRGRWSGCAVSRRRGVALARSSGLANTDAAHLSTAVELVSTRHEQAPVPLDRRSRRRGVGSRSETRPGPIGAIRPAHHRRPRHRSLCPARRNPRRRDFRRPHRCSGGQIVADAGDVIDARGKLVVPGLIDIHTHTGRSADGPGLVLQDGVTGWIDAGSQARITLPIRLRLPAQHRSRPESSSTSAGWASSPKATPLDLARADAGA